MDLNITQISCDQLSRLRALFKSAFGTSPPNSVLMSKHDTSYTGLRDIGFVAYDAEGCAAGYYGVFPVVARINGNLHLIAQSGDTMVHPKHTGKGLFTSLAELTYELCKAKQIEGVFGFPSPSSYPGFVKRLGWQHKQDINRYRFLTPMLPISEILWRCKLLKHFLLSWQKLLLKVFGDSPVFPGTLMDGKYDCIDRSIEYWSYKMSKPEVRAILIDGIEVIVKLEGSLGIGDINTSNPLLIRRIIKKLKILCFFGGIHRINTYVSPGTPLDLALSCIKEPSKGLPIGYLDFHQSISQQRLCFCYLDMDTF